MKYHVMPLLYHSLSYTHAYALLHWHSLPPSSRPLLVAALHTYALQSHSRSLSFSRYTSPHHQISCAVLHRFHCIYSSNLGHSLHDVSQIPTRIRYLLWTTPCNPISLFTPIIRCTHHRNTRIRIKRGRGARRISELLAGVCPRHISLCPNTWTGTPIQTLSCVRLLGRLAICLCTCQCVRMCMSPCLTECLLMPLTASLPIQLCLPMYPIVCLSVWLPFFPSGCVCMCLTERLSLYLSVCVSVCLKVLPHHCESSFGSTLSPSLLPTPSLLPLTPPLTTPILLCYISINESEADEQDEGLFF